MTRAKGNAAIFREFLNTGNLEKALDFCMARLEEDGPSSYYEFWHAKLVANKDHQGGRPPLLYREPKNTLIDFTEIPYQITDDPSGIDDKSDLANLRKEAVKASPFKAEIYLPTEKISLADQVVGIRRVSQLASTANKAVSQDRFEKLEKAISALGKDRIFILGNGPSLKKTDLSLLTNEVTIGFNGIFLHDTFVPTIYIVEDHLVAEDRSEEISTYECPVKLFPSYLGYCLNPSGNTIFLNHLPRTSFPVDHDFSCDAANKTYTGGTVTYTGLQVAVSLGFKKIYLVGVDASYTVANVDRKNDYGTGVLVSKSSDPNHFDSRYFGKGYRWHDPNVHTMLQAYRKAKLYTDREGAEIVNSTVGGNLNLFERQGYYQLFDRNISFPKVAFVDFTHLNWLCATGILKQNLIDGWPQDHLFHVHAEHGFVSSFQNVPHDTFPVGADEENWYPVIRGLFEFNPSVLYLRPTQNNHELLLLQLILGFILGTPTVVHLMDDWIEKVRVTDKASASTYYSVMKYLFRKAQRVFAISPKMADMLERSFDVDKEKIEVIHNFVSDGALVMRGVVDEEVIRYFGGLEPDMSLHTVKLLAQAIQSLNDEKALSLRFEIFTSKTHVLRYGRDLESFDCVRVCEAIADHDEYLALLASSKLNVLAYNFDPVTETYLKYSMANKLPDLLSVRRPFIAIGSVEIGTMGYLKDSNYPHLVLRDDPVDIARKIFSIISDENYSEDVSAELNIDRFAAEFSESSNKWAFQNELRAVSRESPTFDESDTEELLALVDQVRSLPNSRSWDDEFIRNLLKLTRAESARLVELVATHGSAWHITEELADVSPALRDRSLKGDKAKWLAFKVVSLGNARFREKIDALVS